MTGWKILHFSDVFPVEHRDFPMSLATPGRGPADVRSTRTFAAGNAGGAAAGCFPRRDVSKKIMGNLYSPKDPWDWYIYLHLDNLYYGKCR